MGVVTGQTRTSHQRSGVGKRIHSRYRHGQPRRTCQQSMGFVPSLLPSITTTNAPLRSVSANASMNRGRAVSGAISFAKYSPEMDRAGYAFSTWLCGHPVPCTTHHHNNMQNTVVKAAIGPAGHTRGASNADECSKARRQPGATPPPVTHPHPPRLYHPVPLFTVPLPLHTPGTRAWAHRETPAQRLRSRRHHCSTKTRRRRWTRACTRAAAPSTTPCCQTPAPPAGTSTPRSSHRGNGGGAAVTARDHNQP